MRPTLETPRLVLRPFVAADAEAITAIVSDRELAANTLSIPHPYDRSMADKWLATQEDAFARGEAATFALIARDAGALVGCVGLMIEREHRRAEMGYWMAKEHWSRGYGTEGAAAVLRYAFEKLGLHRVFAHHMSRNPASGRIMAKVGMRHEGTLRGHVLKWGVHEDLELFGILREDYDRLGVG